MMSLYMLFLPIRTSREFIEISKVFNFLRCVGKKVDACFLIDEDQISFDEFEANLDYHDSVIDITGRYLPENLVYRSPTLMKRLSPVWSRFKRELVLCTDVDASLYWMFALTFFSNDFLVLPREIDDSWVESLSKDWAFRSAFVEEKILERAKRGELDVQWIVLTSISSKTEVRCLVFITKDADVFNGAELCCKNAGLVTHTDLNF